MSSLEELAALLEQSGRPASEALEIAQDIARSANDVTLGVTFGGVHGEVLPALWNRARASGATSLTLKLEVESDGYHTGITILERSERRAADGEP